MLKHAVGGFVGALLTWVFGLCFLRGYLRFARFFALARWFFNINGRQWPLIAPYNLRARLSVG